MTAQERLVDAALTFCREDESLRQERVVSRRKCDSVANGDERCNVKLSGEPLCQTCQRFDDMLPWFQDTLRRRRLAKAKMLRAARALTERQERQ